MNTQYARCSRHALRSLVWLAWLISMAGCMRSGVDTPSPFPIVHAKTLLLDAGAFPQTWHIEPCTVGCERSERAGHSIRTFSRLTKAGVVLQQVYAFTEISDATRLFRHLQEANQLAPSRPAPTMALPKSLNYHPTSTDDFTFGCFQDPAPECRAVGRYRNFVVEWYFDIDSANHEGLQMGDIAPILRAMDQRIATTFTVPTPTP